MSRGWRRETKQYVKSIIQMLEKQDLMEKVDEASLSIFGDTYELYQQCRDEIEQNGIVFNSLNGRSVNPIASLQLRCVNTMKDIMKEWGMTARSRRLMAVETDNSEETPISKFLAMCKED